ncbi:hypothetical protein LguiA_023043 [Lonicera macranthoides]
MAACPAVKSSVYLLLNNIQITNSLTANNSLRKLNKAINIMEISAGDRVEICCNEDGLWGSYFEAKIVQRYRKDNYLVEYVNLVTDNDETKKLREVVEASAIRPVPPKTRVAEYELLDVVDVNDLDGWWVGRVTGRDKYNYHVYFEGWGEEFPYPEHKLRAHQEYENGRWITCGQRVPLPLSFRSDSSGWLLS